VKGPPFILHGVLYKGHHSASITGRKVYEAGFFWPSIFKDAKDYVTRCDACQRSGNISSRSKMPQNNIQYGVTHKLSTPYHPQTNGQTEVTNRAIKRILERSVGYNLKNWFEKLDDALWAFRTAYKTPIGCTPFRLVYGKACHLPVKIKYKAYWALKQCNVDLTAAAKNRFMELNELTELRDEAFKMHPGKLKSRWYGLNVVKIVYPYGTIEIIDRNRISFKVNGQRLKKYHDGHTNADDKEVMEFKEDTT
ncbi:reverse transcriptase domain-containing protein, partial [Tanacetum coccineum]